MAESCFLCTMGAHNIVANQPPAGEGFGTCSECSVHACQRHGDKSPRDFRCAECIAAIGTGLALTEPFDDRGARLRSQAPRLSATSAPLRGQFDTERLGAAVVWIHHQVRAQMPLLPQPDHGEPWNAERNALKLLSLTREEAAPAAAAEEVRLRVIAIEALVTAAVIESRLDPEEIERDQRAQIGQIAAAGLAIAYVAREVEDLKTSPLQLHGGLLLPPTVIVLGHAYSVANHFFW